MKRTLSLLAVLLGCLAAPLCQAEPILAPDQSEPAVEASVSDETNPSVAQPAPEAKPVAPQAIILILDPDAKQSEVVKQVVEALEKAGIAKAEPSGTVPEPKLGISVTLGIRKDEPYENVKNLVEAFQLAGVQQMLFSEGGVREESGKEERNLIRLTALPPYTTEDLQRIEAAITASTKQTGLQYVLRTHMAAPEYVPPQPSPDQPAEQTPATDPERMARHNMEVARSIADALIKVKLSRWPINIRFIAGVCTLRGLVGDDEDVALAGNVAGIVPGVTSVQNQLTVGTPLTPAPESKLQVFPLKYAQATEVAEVLKQVYDRGPAKIVPDVRTNSVIVTGPEAQLQEIEALLRKLDEADGNARTQTPQVRVVPIENEASSLSSDEAGWASMVNEIIQELQQERDAIAQKNPASPRIVDLEDSIAKIKDDNVEILTTAAKEQAQTIAGLKNVISMMPASLATARAERDRLVKADPSNPRIRELDQQIATAIVMERTYAKMIAAAESEVGSRLPGLVPLHTEVREATPQELKLQLADLRKQYEEADQQTRTLATQLRKQPNEAKRAELRTAVQRAFVARQSLLRAELMEMQTRLLQTQRSIDLRERISDQIIQRRVEDLLNPQLEWEGSEDGAGDASPQATLDSRRQSAASRLGLRLTKSVAVPQNTRYHGGLLVESVAPHSPADQQGIKAGDILVGLGAWETTDLTHVEFILSQRRTDPLKFYILRGAETLYGHLVPGGPPQGGMMPGTTPGYASPAPATPETIHTNSAKNESSVLGILLEFHPSQDQAMGTPLQGEFHVAGVLFNRPAAGLLFTSPAAAAGIQPGDILTELGPLKITSRKQLDDVLREFNSDRLAFAVVRDGKTVKGTFRVPLDAVAISELEGNWHLVSSRDEEGERRDVPPTNRTFRGDRSTVVWSGGGHECRIKVNPEAKTIWYYSKEEDNSFTMDHYEWKGDQLILRDSPGDEEYEVFERGHVRIPKVVPPATKEQETRWRSGIVEIMIGGELAGRGVVVSPKGLILCQLTGGYRNGSIIAAKFDDGSQVELTGVEGGEDDEQRLFALQPKDEIRVNHYFPLGTTTYAIGDEVHVCQDDQSSPEHRFAVGQSQIVLTDRQIVTGPSPVWQLTRPDSMNSLYSAPVLSADGELVAMTLMGTGDLLLAVPVAQLKALFPKSLGQLPVAVVPAKETAPAVTELEGDWHLESLTSRNQETHPLMNLTIRGDQYVTTTPPEHLTSCRISIDSKAGTFQLERSLVIDDATSRTKEPTTDRHLNRFIAEARAGSTVQITEKGTYTLRGDDLTMQTVKTEIREVFKTGSDQGSGETGSTDQIVRIWRRGHRPFPKTVPAVSDEQKLRWRSAIVEIVASGNSEAIDGGGERVIGRGAVVSPGGLILTHLAGGWAGLLQDWRIAAKFDDGSQVDLTVVEQGGAGLVAFQPKDAIPVNHFFPLSTTIYSTGDEVYVGRNDMSSPAHRLTIGASKVVLTDRKIATGPSPVWQLEESTNKDQLGDLPVLTPQGELVALTLQGTGDLLLAVPVGQLKELFPKALGKAAPLPSDPQPAAPISP